MYSLEDQIELYIDENFSAESAAQRFFASYGESDISKKLNEMGNIQLSIETVLKQKVRSNYGMFLQANDQINQVGVEMADLKHLIENTQKLINDVRHNRLADSRAMRTNSLLPTLQYRLQEEAAKNQTFKDNQYGAYGRDSPGMGPAASSKMPSWLGKASEDLARYIVEQQYGKAVGVVLKTRAYAESLTADIVGAKGGAVSAAAVESNSSAVLEVLKDVNEKSAHLAVTIKKSLLNLPNSPLWGSSEQNKRMKLLIALGEFHMAADGFSLSKVTSVRKALRGVEFMGDTLAYTSELSRSFFGVLTEASSSFLQLFGESCEKPAIMSLLLQWIHAQVTAFVDVLARQIQLGINECAAVIIIQLRQLGSGFDAEDAARKVAAANRRRSMLGFGEENEGTGAVQSVQPFSNNNSPVSANSARPQVAPPSPARKSSAIGKGSLTFAASCLEMAFSEARSMERLLLQSTPVLGWVLLPETQKFVSSYAEEFIKEIAAQVRQDSWMPVAPQFISVQMPGRAQGFERTGAGGAPSVSLSYDWVTAVLNHFCDEVWVLLRADSSEDQGNSSYSRADVCEVEPTAVGCLMRILLRYVVELESADTSGLTTVQLGCYIQTVEAVASKLIPSLQRVTSECFFADSASLQSNAPQTIFKLLLPRLQRLARDKKDAVQQED